MGAYWACASLARVDLALHFLTLAGFTTYTPRVRRERKNGGPDGTALLFPDYTFLSLETQWHRAARTPGVIKLIMDGEHPARVPDPVIEGLRAQERDGLVQLSTRPAFVRGDRVRILHGAFQSQIAIFESMAPRKRVELLLHILGAERRIKLKRRDIRRLNGLG